MWSIKIIAIKRWSVVFFFAFLLFHLLQGFVLIKWEHWKSILPVFFSSFSFDFHHRQWNSRIGQLTLYHWISKEFGNEESLKLSRETCTQHLWKNTVITVIRYLCASPSIKRTPLDWAWPWSLIIVASIFTRFLLHVMIQDEDERWTNPTRNCIPELKYLVGILPRPWYLLSIEENTRRLSPDNF